MAEKAGVVYKKVKKLVLFSIHVSNKEVDVEPSSLPCLYSPGRLAGKFSETGLPVFSILGNSTVLCKEFPFHALSNFVPY